MLNPTRLSDDALEVWIVLLNTEIDLANAGEDGPIPMTWLEARCAESVAERAKRAEVAVDDIRAA